MGYDLHITRRDDWWEDGENIPEGDWTALVESDPTLTMTGSVSTTTPDGSTISYDSPLLAEWAHDGASIPFDFRSGRVVVKNPDGPILAKMIEIADSLDAKVVGDEGEVYSKTETHGIALEGVAKDAPEPSLQQTGGGCLGMFIVLVLIVVVAIYALEQTGANKASILTPDPLRVESYLIIQPLTQMSERALGQA